MTIGLLNPYDYFKGVLGIDNTPRKRLRGYKDRNTPPKKNVKQHRRNTIKRKHK